MSAAVQLKEFYPFEQKYEKGILSYRVMSRQNVYNLDRDTISDEGQFTTSVAIEKFISRCEFQNSSQEEVDPSKTFNKLKEMLSPIYSDEQDWEKTITAIFILSTYMYQVFDRLPSLWFYVPRIYQRPIVEGLLKNLCFNGIIVTNNYTPEVITTCISKLTPTLIFQQYNRSKSSRLDSLFSNPNTKNHFLPTEELEAIQLYCPKIILSSLLPPPYCQSHVLALIANRPPQAELAEEENAYLRGELLKMALFIHEQLSKTGDVCKSPNDVFSTMLELASTLAAIGVLTKEELSTLSNTLTDKKKAILRNGQLNHENDLFIGISEYLRSIEDQKGDEFVALSDLVDFLNEIETVGFDMDARRLRRFLNSFKLIEEAKRPRFDTGVVDKAGKPVRTQKTSVKIDKPLLRKLKYSDLTYEQQ